MPRSDVIYGPGIGHEMLYFKILFKLPLRIVMGVRNSRLSAVEADGCQVSRPLRGLHDFIPTACVRNMRTWGGAWHVDLGVG